MPIGFSLEEIPGHEVTLDAISSETMILCYCSCGEDFSTPKTEHTLSMNGAILQVARVCAHLEDYGAKPNENDPLHDLVQSFRKEK